MCCHVSINLIAAFALFLIFVFFFTLSRRFIDGKLSDFLAGVICSFRASCFICYHYLLLLFLLLLLLLMFGGGLSTVLSVSHALTHLLLDEFVAGQNKIEKRGEKKTRRRDRISVFEISLSSDVIDCETTGSIS